MNSRKIFCFLILLLTVISVNQWNTVFSIGTTLSWFVSFVLLIYTIRYLVMLKLPNKQDYYCVSIYLVYALIGCVRGVFVADDYWTYKQLVSGVLSLSLPLFVYPFSNSFVTGDTFRYWLKYAVPLYFLIFIWAVVVGAHHFYLGPIFLLLCYFHLLPKKWKLIVGFMALIMLTANLGARSQVIKTAVCILVALGCYFRGFITTGILRIAHWVCYIVPVVLLVLGILGVFNIFEDLSSNEGKHMSTKVVDGHVVEEDLSADTRTFIYVESITSAINHNYVLFGRTPARGNDSITFGSYMGDKLGTGRYERHMNEVCHPNVFTWLGLVGMLLYCYLYFKGSFLALYKSNNFYIKILGVFVAFRWAFGWIEDFNRFSIMSISLWMMIGMCFSYQFRKMTNTEFEGWFKSIFRN